ncbi:NAC domain-containing protein 22-like isoform X2 [Musa acuminata AAA Group]|uniref:NAC domain-containing protein 22-like isoform X2 n=1 Tax=Musa acuminata AAA Group TaxID=214697 RepID=UPI0031E343CF
MERSGLEMDLPGFRFHPTEEELLDFYLRRMVQGKKLQLEIISTINLYHYDPWELPGMAKIGEREWYFYVPRDRRQASGGRPSRTTERGFWKATGCERPVRSAADPKRLIGYKKTLVYYQGRAPRGSKTDWVMNEYRLPDPLLKDVVLCKVYRKPASMKELEKRAAAMEGETTMTVSQNSGSTAESASGSYQERLLQELITAVDDVIVIEDASDVVVVIGDEAEEEVDASTASNRRPSLLELEVPKNSELEWLQDSFFTQLTSPWLESWSPYYDTMLNR